MTSTSLLPETEESCPLMDSQESGGGLTDILEESMGASQKRFCKPNAEIDLDLLLQKNSQMSQLSKLQSQGLLDTQSPVKEKFIEPVKDEDIYEKFKYYAPGIRVFNFEQGFRKFRYGDLSLGKDFSYSLDPGVGKVTSSHNVLPAQLNQDPLFLLDLLSPSSPSSAIIGSQDDYDKVCTYLFYSLSTMSPFDGFLNEYAVKTFFDMVDNFEYKWKVHLSIIIDILTNYRLDIGLLTTVNSSAKAARAEKKKTRQKARNEAAGCIVEELVAAVEIKNDDSDIKKKENSLATIEEASVINVPSKDGSSMEAENRFVLKSVLRKSRRRIFNQGFSSSQPLPAQNVLKVRDTNVWDAKSEGKRGTGRFREIRKSSSLHVGSAQELCFSTPIATTTEDRNQSAMSADTSGHNNTTFYSLSPEESPLKEEDPKGDKEGRKSIEVKKKGSQNLMKQLDGAVDPNSSSESLLSTKALPGSSEGDIEGVTMDDSVGDGHKQDGEMTATSSFNSTHNSQDKNDFVFVVPDNKLRKSPRKACHPLVKPVPEAKSDVTKLKAVYKKSEDDFVKVSTLQKEVGAPLANLKIKLRPPDHDNSVPPATLVNTLAIIRRLIVKGNYEIKTEEEMINFIFILLLVAQDINFVCDRSLVTVVKDILTSLARDSHFLQDSQVLRRLAVRTIVQFVPVQLSENSITWPPDNLPEGMVDNGANHPGNLVYLVNLIPEDVSSLANLKAVMSFISLQLILDCLDIQVPDTVRVSSVWNLVSRNMDAWLRLIHHPPAMKASLDCIEGCLAGQDLLDRIDGSLQDISIRMLLTTLRTLFEMLAPDEDEEDQKKAKDQAKLRHYIDRCLKRLTFLSQEEEEE